MELRKYYANLHKSALAAINKEGFSQDMELDNPLDLRRGLILLLRPSNHKFGQQLFDQVEFVYNDWYQRKSIVKTLNSYTLPFR